MVDRDTLSFVKASVHRPLTCYECSHSEGSSASQTAETAGTMFCLQSTQASDPLQLPDITFHHVTCLPLVTLHCATPTGSVARIDGYTALSDEVKRALRSELSPLLRRAVDVMRDVQDEEFNRLAKYYIHQQSIGQLQCKQCDRMLLDAVELPCCPAYQLCALCWQACHLSSSVQAQVSGCETCEKPSTLATLVSCPSCNQGVDVATVVEDNSMRVRVGGKLVRCPNEKYGCEIVVMAKDALDHISQCPHQATKQARARERKMDVDSEQDEEDEEADESEEVPAGSGSDSKEEPVDEAAAGENVTSTRTVSSASPLVTSAVAASAVEKGRIEKDMEKQSPDTRMMQQRAESKLVDETVLKPSTPTVAADAVTAITLTVAGTETRGGQSKLESPSEASGSTQNTVDDSASHAQSNGLTTLVSTDASGATLSLSLLALRQQIPQQTASEDRPPAHTTVADGALKRQAEVEGAADEQDRKRIKTEAVLVE